MVTGNIKTQAYQNPVTAAGNTHKISTKTDFSQSIRQAAGSYAGTDNKSQNVSRNQEAAKDSSTAKNAVKSEMTDRDAKSSDVRSTKTETAAVDKNSEKEETNPEIAAVDKNSEKEEINLEIAAVLAGTQLQNTAVDLEVSRRVASRNAISFSGNTTSAPQSYGQFLQTSGTGI